MRPGIAPLAALAALAALVLAGCGPDAALDALAPAGSGRVVAAPEGDLLVLDDGTRVRLAGVEAPKGSDPFAVDSRITLGQLALGRQVELMSGGARQDRYGRTLAQVRRLDGRVWLEDALLRAGAARVRIYPDNRALAGAMLEAEAHARIAKRGLWASPAYKVLLPREVAGEADGFAIVEGRVSAVERQGRTLLLAFAPAVFAAEVPAAARDDFSAAGLEPAALKGRLVRVRGDLRPTVAGPRLWLDTPEAVEILIDKGAGRRR